MYTMQDFKKWDSSPIEKLPLKFCKRYLEVNKKASNKACRAGHEIASHHYSSQCSVVAKTKTPEN